MGGVLVESSFPRNLMVSVGNVLSRVKHFDWTGNLNQIFGSATSIGHLVIPTH